MYSKYTYTWGQSFNEILDREHELGRGVVIAERNSSSRPLDNRSCRTNSTLSLSLL